MRLVDLFSRILNCPRFDGRDLLRNIRSKDVTRRIPVVVVTENGDPKETEQAYGLGAISVLVKSDGYEDLLRNTIDYWVRQSSHFQAPM